MTWGESNHKATTVPAISKSGAATRKKSPATRNKMGWDGSAKRCGSGNSPGFWGRNFGTRPGTLVLILSHKLTILFASNLNPLDLGYSKARPQRVGE